jgi:hypothetical protein
MKTLSSTFLLLFILFSVVCFSQNNSINGVGVSTNLTGFYDYQSSGGAISYIEMNPTDTNKIHAIYMTALDSLNISSSRRTKCNFSSDGGIGWQPSPATVPSLRSGYPSLTLDTHTGYSAVIATFADLTYLGTFKSYLFFEQSEGNLIFGDGFTPAEISGGSNEPIYPQVVSSTNGNIVMLSATSNSSGLYVTVMDTFGIFSNWLSVGNGFVSSAIAAGPDSQVAIGWFSSNLDTIKYRISSDNGISWGPLQVAAVPTAEKRVASTGLDLIFFKGNLYIAYVASSRTEYYRSSRVEVFNSNTSNFTVAIDSTNFPQLMKTISNPGYSQFHSFTFNYPTLGKDLAETRLYVACGAFIQNNYQTDGGGQNWPYGDIIYTRSDNEGNSWFNPENLTNTPTLDERYPSLSTWNPMHSFYVAFQEDNVPGSFITDSRPVSRATLKFLKVPSGIWNSISGKTFRDLNNNGVKDYGEVGISGWKIRLSLNDILIDSSTTNYDGNYSFTMLPDGSYKVTEETKAGWTQTLPTPPGSYTFDLLDGQIAQNMDFGNYFPYPIVHFSNIIKGWNLLSLPKLVLENRTSVLYPEAISPAYEYQSGYKVKDSLKNGTGYWLKCAEENSIYIGGSGILEDTFQVVAGWNMIGSLSIPYLVINIFSEPAEIVTSQFFGYNGTYFNADTIQPHKGYWVKVNQTGSLILSSQMLKRGSARIRIVPTSEMPPPAPSGGVDNKPIPRSYGLEQCYPNPFNPSTRIEYQLPFDSKIRLTVYSILGQEITTLSEGIEVAGYQSIGWNAADQANGIYFYRLEATSVSDPSKMFTQVKKMLLVK